MTRATSGYERIEVVHHTGRMAAPFTEQNRLNCFGLSIFRRKRRAQLMFNDGPSVTPGS